MDIIGVGERLKKRVQKNQKEVFVQRDVQSIPRGLHWGRERRRSHEAIGRTDAVAKDVMEVALNRGVFARTITKRQAQSASDYPP
jgi:hypothetical protein